MNREIIDEGLEAERSPYVHEWPDEVVMEYCREIAYWHTQILGEDYHDESNWPARCAAAVAEGFGREGMIFFARDLLESLERTVRLICLQTDVDCGRLGEYGSSKVDSALRKRIKHWQEVIDQLESCDDDEVVKKFLRGGVDGKPNGEASLDLGEFVDALTSLVIDLEKQITVSDEILNIMERTGFKALQEVAKIASDEDWNWRVEDLLGGEDTWSEEEFENAGRQDFWRREVEVLEELIEQREKMARMRSEALV